jgi:hypothetical protein
MGNRFFHLVAVAWGKALKKPAGDGTTARTFRAKGFARASLPGTGGRGSRRSFYLPSSGLVLLPKTVFFVTAVPDCREFRVTSSPADDYGEHSRPGCGSARPRAERTRQETPNGGWIPRLRVGREGASHCARGGRAPQANGMVTAWPGNFRSTIQTIDNYGTHT